MENQVDTYRSCSYNPVAFFGHKLRFIMDTGKYG